MHIAQNGYFKLSNEKISCVTKDNFLPDLQTTDVHYYNPT